MKSRSVDVSVPGPTPVLGAELYDAWLARGGISGSMESPGQLLSPPAQPSPTTPAEPKHDGRDLSSRPRTDVNHVYTLQRPSESPDLLRPGWNGVSNSIAAAGDGRFFSPEDPKYRARRRRIALSKQASFKENRPAAAGKFRNECSEPSQTDRSQMDWHARPSARTKGAEMQSLANFARPLNPPSDPSPVDKWVEEMALASTLLSTSPYLALADEVCSPSILIGPTYHAKAVSKPLDGCGAAIWLEQQLAVAPPWVQHAAKLLICCDAAARH